MSTTDYKFEGWVGHDKDSVGNLKFGTFEPKTWTEDDVDIKIEFCGICSSDLHTLRSGWGPTDYPQVVGHEIAGKAVRVGTNVTGIKLGDRIGVGAQSGSCLACEDCNKQKESYCANPPGMIPTYGGKYADGSKSTGGYANYARVPSHFCIPIPEGIPSEIAAPMMCGGVTVYSPLKQNNVGPGMNVGIVGIGGLGHFGLLFAKALGARVTAISRSRSKEADARELGADDFIATSEEGWVQKYARHFDLIVCTANNADMPLAEYCTTLKVGHGKFVMVGAPEESITFNVFPLLMANVSIGGSLIGSPSEIREMLELAVKANVRSWIEVRDLKDVNQALIDMEDGKPRFRYVLKCD
ncbi:hypothetical protein YB2330_006452 [Saitoella coloradoensis]